MSTKKLDPVLGKIVFVASVVSLSFSLLTTTISASPISSGIEQFTSGNSLGAAIGLSFLGQKVIDSKGVLFAFGRCGPTKSIDTFSLPSTPVRACLPVFPVSSGGKGCQECSVEPPLSFQERANESLLKALVFQADIYRQLA